MSVDPAAIPPAAYVQITLGEVYSEVTGMRQEVRDLAATIRQAVTQVGDHETRLRTVEKDGATKEEQEKLEARITALERWRWGWGSAIAVLATALSSLIGWLAKLH